MAKEVDFRAWSDLADECEAKGIKVDAGEKAASLREKLAAKDKSSQPKEKLAKK